jgi:hypothetical protein
LTSTRRERAKGIDELPLTAGELRVGRGMTTVDGTE